MKVIIDRFEGEFAICEKDDKEMIEIKRSDIPSFAKEGDVLIIESDGIKIDTIETAKRKQMIESLIQDLWEK